MKKSFFLLCTTLLLVTSCKSSKAVFNSMAVQENTYIEQNENMVSSPLPGESKKSTSFVYHSLQKTESMPTNFDVTRTVADLKVQPNKIEYTCAYYGADNAEGRKAAINYAINQALIAHGNADLLVEPKYEIKSDDGRITTVKVSGYVATYCNFRTATKEDLNMLNTKVVSATPRQDATGKTN